jgi:hypothetical protein
MLLDVQGYEGPALQGLQHHRPELLVIEDSEEYLERAGTSRAKLYAQVRGMGYALHDVFGGDVDESGPLPAECNVVAVGHGVDVHWCPSESMTPITAHHGAAL